jgi:two-component system response regulator AtoC
MAATPAAIEEQAGLSVLVIDDDESLRDAIVINLELAGYSVRPMADGLTALEILKENPYTIVLCDLRMPKIDGLEFTRRCKEISPDTAVVIMTGFGNTELAVEALRAGAYDYMSKPFEPEELILTLRKIEEREKLRAENAELKSAITQRYNFSNIIAESDSMKGIFETVKRLANFSTTVLITGESGTGKELLAKAIHHNSPRRGKPFVAINCGAIPENLIESELFGHKKGSFTDATRDKKGLFEEADGGTIFLDEIGELPTHLQVKLLRTLQEQEIRRVGDEQAVPIDVRVIAATLRNLEEDVDGGRFRDDLFYRLNVVSIHIPPLRERPEDIPILVEHFMAKHNKRLGLKITKVYPDALRCLVSAPWRGNVRELENCIERALVLTDTDGIDLTALSPNVRESSAPAAEAAAPRVDEGNLSIKQRTRALEIDLITRALKKTRGNRTHAAKILEISHRALLYKLKEYGLGDIALADGE